MYLTTFENNEIRQALAYMSGHVKGNDSYLRHTQRDTIMNAREVSFWEYLNPKDFLRTNMLHLLVAVCSQNEIINRDTLLHELFR